MNIITETSRLILRELTLEDVDALHAIMGDPQIMAFSLYGTRTREEVHGIIETQLSEYQQRGYGNWAVVEKDSNQFVGFCGLRPQTVEGETQAEIAYRFNKAWHGKGLATEAARAVRDHAFQALGMDKVISIIEPQNIPSIRVAEKNGMTLERECVYSGVAVGVYAVRLEDLKK